MKFDIIETGSSGNCFIYDESVMVDVGVPMSHLKDVNLQKITHILLTHIHSDHFNKATIRTISNKYKHIKFVFGEWLREPMRLLRVQNFEVIEMNKLYHSGQFSYAGVIAYHDVENCGYRLVFGEHKHFHITDTGTLLGITARNYDTATIECNYHDDAAVAVIDQKQERGEYAHNVAALQNHLSVQEAVEFVKDNNIGKLYPVHIGSDTRGDVMRYLKETK